MNTTEIPNICSDHVVLCDPKRIFSVGTVNFFNFFLFGDLSEPELGQVNFLVGLAPELGGSGDKAEKSKHPIGISRIFTKTIHIPKFNLLAQGRGKGENMRGTKSKNKKHMPKKKILGAAMGYNQSNKSRSPKGTS